MSQKIAIIGSGLSGSVLSYYLQKSANVSLFEKSQGVSGRMSTRSFANFEFDHGAQFFTARSNKFNDFLLPFSFTFSIRIISLCCSEINVNSIILSKV